MEENNQKFNEEIEVKLSCPQNFSEILANGKSNFFQIFHIIKNEKINCLNTYFDTLNFDLRQQKIALRFRNIENNLNNQNKHILTIKGSNLISDYQLKQNGLSSRKEFNLEIFNNNNNSNNNNNNEIYLNDYADFLTQYIKNAAQIIPQLQAIFYTNFVRNIYVVNYENLQIEISIDNGKIYSDLINNKVQTISEVEMEIIEGSKENSIFILNDFVDKFCNYCIKQDIILNPLNDSKAKRGYSLFV